MADSGGASRSGTWQSPMTIDAGGTVVEELQTYTTAPQRDTATAYHNTPFARHSETLACTDVACAKLLQQAQQRPNDAPPKRVLNRASPNTPHKHSRGSVTATCLHIDVHTGVLR